MSVNHKKIKKALRKYATLDHKMKAKLFFKIGKGQYGEKDQFIGVPNPDIRKVASQYQDIDLREVELLLQSPIHEDRLCAIILLFNRNKKADLEQRKEIVKVFVDNLEFINSWDMVDFSSHYILGRAIADGIQPMNILDKLAKSPILWERRVAIISTMYFISLGDINPSIKMAKKLLRDKEDLIHKAVGWTLREIWKRQPQIVEQLLRDNYKSIHKTTLRYAVEQFPAQKRLQFLRGEF